MADDKPISVYIAQTKERMTFNPPHGLTKAIDEFLKYVFTKTNIKFSRNEFIVKAIMFYTKHMLESCSEDEMLNRVEISFKMVKSRKKKKVRRLDSPLRS